MKKWVLLTLTLLLAVPMMVLAADGVIKGKVTNAETDRPLAGANVILEGTTLGAASGRLGTFEISGIPAGNYTVKVMFVGYKNQTGSVTVNAGQAAVINFEMEPTTLMTEGVMVQGNRAVERETPIAFAQISGDELADNYTTGDMPDLIKYVPGVFSTSAGLGESELRVRGFDQDKVQIMINGIPVNDPESQQVYWSNWTGLSSNTKSVQVQRGAGSSLYGSGVFGGSVNIETMGVTPESGITFRSSVGYYSTEGNADGEVANGNGGFKSYNPMNYNASLRYNSGLLYDGKLNYSILFERKAGDSYVVGTGYDGYSMGLELQSILGAHKLLLSVIGAPQSHNQSRTDQDIELVKTLGREYNRNAHEFQENYYFKPQVSLRHEWTISEKQFMSTNVFATMGKGGGKYFRNASFDTQTGKVDYQAASAYNDAKYFGRHARWAYETAGIVLDGYDPEAKTYRDMNVSYGKNAITGDYSHAWQNDSHNEHNQFGINTYYQHQLNDMIRFTVGGEYRYWHGFHFARSWDYGKLDPRRGVLMTIPEVQRRYDYDGFVHNASGFARVMAKPIDKLTLQADVNYAWAKQSIDENPIEIFDLGISQWTGTFFRASMDMKNEDGTAKFSTDDYERTYSFVSPKFGANYNINDNFNVLANVSIAKKEPRVGDWYHRDKGPGANQLPGVELNPEQTTNMEMGFGYATANLGANVNYYYAIYDDKIEYVRDDIEGNQTINAGKAVHQGLELSVRGNYGKFDFASSLTWAQNRWQEMGPDQIFGVDASEVVDKVVPFTPERMANGNLGYSLDSGIRFGLGFNWFDEYYATYTNMYEKRDLTTGDVIGEEEAKLPSFLDVSFNVSVPFMLAGKHISVRLDLNNITNNDNYSRARYGKDYNRNDALGGKMHWYVQQAPKFNAFITTSIEL